MKIIEYIGLGSLTALFISNYFSFFGWSMLFFCLGFIMYLITLITWQKNREVIIKSNSLALFSMIIFMVTVILLFAGGFQISSHYGEFICYNTNGSTDEIKCFIDFLYYSAITATSLGFGDIVPHPDAFFTKILTMIEIIFGPIFVISVISTHLSSISLVAGGSTAHGSIGKNIFNDK